MRHHKPQSLSPLQCQNWNPFVIFVVISVFDLTSSSIIPIPRNYKHNDVLVTKISEQERYAAARYYVNDYTCYDVFGNGYLGDTPHPSNCNYYIRCVERTGQPVPLLTRCEPGEFFDMNQCECVDPDEDLLCFDPMNPDHESMKFNCAHPVVNSRRRLTHGKLLPFI